jgi:Asp-tRNA(Asn)/Glu-tRNA(Gln) amidotransferase A subunit family amidase
MVDDDHTAARLSCHLGGVTDGLSAGVQLLARRFREDTLFDAAEVIEAHADITTPTDPAG